MLMFDSLLPFPPCGSISVTEANRIVVENISCVNTYVYVLIGGSKTNFLLFFMCVYLDLFLFLNLHISKFAFWCMVMSFDKCIVIGLPSQSRYRTVLSPPRFLQLLFVGNPSPHS